MNPTHVTIIPAAGHSDDEGKYTRGRYVDTISEVEIVDQYSRTLCEILEEYGVSHSVMDTRRAPGVKESERLGSVRQGSIFVGLGVGWFDNLLKRNRSEVFYVTPESRKLAAMVGETVGDWGRCSSYKHVAGNPKELRNGFLRVSGPVGILLEPFALNGPHYCDYLPMLGSLGRYVGMTIIEYMVSNNPTAGYQPFTVKHYAP